MSKTKKQVFAIAMAIMFVFSSAMLINAQETTPVVKIDPALKEVIKGDIFTIDIRVEDVNDLYGFQLSLKYDESYLQFIDCTEGDFLSGKDTPANATDDSVTSFGSGQKKNEYLCNIFNTRLSSDGRDGSGVLVKIRFKALKSGTSNIEIVEDDVIEGDACATLLSNSEQSSIEYEAEDGTVEANCLQPIADPSGGDYYGLYGWWNGPTSPATTKVEFDGSGSYECGGSLKDDKYSWDFGDGCTTTSLPNVMHKYSSPGEYTIMLQVEDEDGCESSTKETKAIIYNPGDVNHDWKVDIFDLVTVAQNFGYQRLSD